MTYDCAFFLILCVKDATPAPFLEVKVTSSPEVKLHDLVWNPGSDFSTLFVTNTSDGAVSLWEVKDSLTVVASLPTSALAQCG